MSHGASTLTPDDLEPVRALVGDDAIEFAHVGGQFHFMTRIADLLAVDLELPTALRGLGERFAWVRAGLMSILSRVMRSWDLDRRHWEGDAQAVLDGMAPDFLAITGEPLGDQLDVLRPRPQLLESLALDLDALVHHTSLSREQLARIWRVVHEALPASIDDVEGLHPRPSDPLDAFAFVGTRYPARTTAAMIEALRAQGFDDLGLLDAAFAIALANAYAREYRLLGVDALAPIRWR